MRLCDGYHSPPKMNKHKFMALEVGQRVYSSYGRLREWEVRADKVKVSPFDGSETMIKVLKTFMGVSPAYIEVWETDEDDIDRFFTR